MPKLYIAVFGATILVMFAMGAVAMSLGVVSLPWSEAHSREAEKAQIQKDLASAKEDAARESRRAGRYEYQMWAFASVVHNKGDAGYGINHPQPQHKDDVVIIKVEGDRISIESTGGPLPNQVGMAASYLMR